MSYHTLPSSMSASSDAAVQVAVRIRPVNSRQTPGPSLSAPVCHVDSRNSQLVILDPPSSRLARRPLFPPDKPDAADERLFTFDFVYDDNDGSAPPPPHTTSFYQQRVYEDFGQQIVANAVAGYHCSLLAYGQTSSGKSHSMMGTADDDGFGLIPRICSALFSHISSSPPTSPSGDSVLRKLECSYVEIYSERIRDLLDPRKRNLKVRENPKTGPYVEGVSCCAVSDYSELSALMASGNAERTIAATNMNAESSRSHAVFTLQLTTTTIDADTQLSSDVVSKVQLVDLAGSERVDTSGATGLRLKEASQINKSLTTLGRVVQALAARGESSGPRGSTFGTMTRKSVVGGKRGEDVFVPFRDSALTWLLKESLGGNSKTFMLATVSPSEVNVDETLSTLRYASRAKRIVNKARVNEDPNAELIRSLKAEVDALRARLAQTEAAGSTSPTMSASSLPSRIRYTAGSEEFDVSASSTLSAETLREKDAELLSMNAHIARLQSELAQTSVSFVEMELTWQSKLRQAKALEEARLQDMQQRGVSLTEVRHLPFLVNLNEDPALTESLIYHLPDGRSVIGSRKRPLPSTPPHLPPDPSPSPPPEEHRIVLSGVHVREDHCLLTKHSNGVVISPLPGVQAETHINGELLKEDRALVHGDRVVVGQLHFFRFSRSKLAIEEDRGREEERRQKRREAKARLSVITSPPGGVAPPQQSPLSPERVDPASFDFDFAQRELIVGGGRGAGGGKGRGGGGGRGGRDLNRSLNRSRIEDREPDSSPEGAPQRGMALPPDGDAPTLFHLSPIPSPVRPSTAPSVSQSSGSSPSLQSSGAESASPSCVKVTHPAGEEKEREGEGELQLQAPTFHLGRDVKGSVDWSSRRALTRGEIDEWIRQDRRYLAREKQRLIDRAHSHCQQLMQPLGQCTAAEFRAANHAVYRWRLLVVKRAVGEEVMRLVFLCDEANAIASALGRVERYKVELASSHCMLADMWLSSTPFTTAFSQPQSSPLQRLRQMKVVFCQVVEVRRRQLPIPVLAFDLPTFQEQLGALRDLYNDMLEGVDDPASRTLTGSSGSGSVTPSPSPALPLPSSILYQQPQLLGRGLCWLQGLRYGQAIKHSVTVWDERGEVAGTLGVEMEIASVDEDVARREISAEEKARMREEREEEQHRLRAALPSDDGDDDSPLPPLTPQDEEAKTESFLQAHRTMAVIVRLTAFDTQTRQLRRHGLQSLWLKYHVKDNPAAYRTRKVQVADEVSRYRLEYERTHYFSGIELQMMIDWLTYDALVLEVWCRVEEPHAPPRLTPTPLLHPVHPTTPATSKTPVRAAVQSLSAPDDAEDTGRRESLAKRIQSPSLRGVSGAGREWGEKSVESRMSVSGMGPRHARKPTLQVGGVGGVGRVEEMKVEVENGTKLVDHLLFACVDVEEDLHRKAAFTPCSLKGEDDGRAICRITLHRERRLVVSILQADHRPFVLESLRAITVAGLTLRTATSRSTPTLTGGPIYFPIVEQFAQVEHKLLICTAAWAPALDALPLFGQVSAAGERVQLQLQLECYFSETTVPVHVPVTLEMKLYKGESKGGGLFRPRAAAAAANDGERLARLGCHVTVTRQSSPQTVGNVLREHELLLEQMQRRIRFEQQLQHRRLLTQLQQTTPHFVDECREGYDRGADGLCRHFSLRFSRILADLRMRGGIRVEVDSVSEEAGIKCGYLNERRKGGGEWEPRWCVLRPPYLFIYTRRGERREQAMVKLMKAELSQGAQGDWSFTIRNTSGVTFTLQAANEAERRSWLKALGAPH